MALKENSLILNAPIVHLPFPLLMFSNFILKYLAKGSSRSDAAGVIWFRYDILRIFGNYVVVRRASEWN